VVRREAGAAAVAGLPDFLFMIKRTISVGVTCGVCAFTGTGRLTKPDVRGRGDIVDVWKGAGEVRAW